MLTPYLVLGTLITLSASVAYAYLKINRAIEKNRGLTRARKRIDSNPRVKNREKFRKASIRRKGQVREVKSPSSAAYSGEATGIKKNVSHSVRFK